MSKYKNLLFCEQKRSKKNFSKPGRAGETANAPIAYFFRLRTKKATRTPLHCFHENQNVKLQGMRRGTDGKAWMAASSAAMTIYRCGGLFSKSAAF
jgi:hypothetical protein